MPDGVRGDDPGGEVVKEVRLKLDETVDEPEQAEDDLPEARRRLNEGRERARVHDRRSVGAAE
ncbi:MAG: hypothetical protein ACLP8S_04035 [Solirubrobacteraceae bacterium]